MKREWKDSSLNLKIFSLLFLVDCSGTNPCVNGGICENAACTCSSEYTGNLCGDGKIFEDVIIVSGGGGNTFTTFEMIICIRVSTNNYKLSVISLMLRDNKVKYTSTDVTYSKQGLQMII